MIIEFSVADVEGFSIEHFFLTYKKMKDLSLVLRL